MVQIDFEKGKKAAGNSVMKPLRLALAFISRGSNIV
jgi:hypothetical protein